MGDREQAVKHAESALKYAADPNEIKLATDLLAYVRQDPTKATPPPPVDRPQLARREPEVVAPDDTPTDHAEGTYPIEGILQNVDCLDKVARLRLLVGAKQMALLIEDPTNIVIKKRAESTGPHEFTCGPQMPVKVAIEYVLKPDATYKTEGVVRSIEFR